MYIDRKIVTEYEPHKFEVEASTVGLRPGTWPERIPTNLGNQMDLRVSKVHTSWGKIESVVYKQEFGCIELVIQND